MNSKVIPYVFALSFFALLPAWGTDYCVPDHYSTIQDAIWAVSDGDRIFVRPGTYVENIDFGGRDIRVESMAGPEVTIIDGSGNPLLSTVIFVGGEGPSVVLKGFTIKGGSGLWDGYSYYGGGICCWPASPTIAGNIIENNSAGDEYDPGYGGGIYCSDYSSPTITGNIIRNNTAGDYEDGFGGMGGAIFCEESSTPLIEDNVIESNKAGDDGGGIALHDSPAQIVNNLIISNRSCFSGGGIDLQRSDAVITGNTFTNNLAGYNWGGNGGALRCSWSDAIITDNIFWFNYGDSVDEIELWMSAPDVNYNNIRGGWATGTGNINVDPQWVSGPLGGYYLSQDPCQPGAYNLCVDGGDPNSSVPDGTTRTDEEPDVWPADMGYHYAFTAPTTWYVPDDFTTIQDAIIAASDNDTIVVKPGTYVENIDFFGKAVTVRSEWGPRATVIDGGSPAIPDYGAVVTFLCGEGSDSVLDGFTVTNGLGRVGPHNPQGMLHGGGVFCYGASPTIRGNIISDNEAETGGGVACLDHAHVTLVDNVISGNNALLGVGGMDIWNFSQPTVSNTVICGNTALNMGGGVRSRWGSSATFTNCTIFGNSAAEGGGIRCAFGGHVTLANTILWNNSAATGKEMHLSNDTGPCSATISYSDVEGGQASVQVDSGCTLTWGAGMINAAPLFADSADNDFHLTHTSPCKDTGDDSAVTEPGDWEGDPRIADIAVDMGADEFHLHLYSMSDVVPGNGIDIKVVGTPGISPVTLVLGSGVRNPPVSTQYGSLYLLPPYQDFNIGVIPANGILTVSGTIPLSWQSGEEKPFQALAGPLGNPASELTNHMVMVVE